MKIIAKLIEITIIKTAMGIAKVTICGNIMERLILMFLIVFFLIGLSSLQPPLYIGSSILFILYTSSKSRIRKG